MNVTKSFATFLDDNGFGTENIDLFIGAVSDKAPDSCFWITSAGGTQISKNETNQMLKSYTVSVFYRSRDPEDVYDTMQSLEETINSDECTQLTGYDTIDMDTILFPTDQDIDDQERTVGLLQVNITIYN